MSTGELIIIAVAALATSALSAIAGMGGGLVLLAVMVSIIEPAVAIPIHGAIQIASNSSRAARLREHVDWAIVVRHALLLVPAGLLGLLVIDRIDADIGRIVIGVFALVAVWQPRLITPRIGDDLDRRTFVWVGGAQGFVNIPIGATGPMIAPFFKAALPSRHAFIATFAAAQTLGHIAKVGVFTADGLDLAGHLDTIGLAVVAVVAGTHLGARVLDRLSDKGFDVIFKTILTIVAVRLIVVSLI